jgi:hypothetical protein
MAVQTIIQKKDNGDIFCAHAMPSLKHLHDFVDAFFNNRLGEKYPWNYRSVDPQSKEPISCFILYAQSGEEIVAWRAGMEDNPEECHVMLRAGQQQRFNELLRQLASFPDDGIQKELSYLTRLQMVLANGS